MTGNSERAKRLPYWVFEEAPGTLRIEMTASDIHCAGCIAKIETALKREPGVNDARVNLSTKRITVRGEEGSVDPESLLASVKALGFSAHPFQAGSKASTQSDAQLRSLVWALALSGFAAANIMLLSVSIWSGATETTRDLFHWLSALIAIPAVVYAGRPFYRSAWAALSHAHLNMDVPISLAVILATGASLYETMIGGEETYFDASVMLLFFLLIGRTLDHMMRARARSAVAELVNLSPAEAMLLTSDGKQQKTEVCDIEPGMSVLVSPGERIPVDGKITNGISDIDCSLVTGETQPQTMKPGGQVFAGMMNLSGPLEIEVTATQDSTLLSDIVRLMEAAEQGKARYVRIATKAAEIYAPAVHILAATTFLGWLWFTGGDWHQALLVSIAVLIITCPCALGLAVPVVQIVASGQLFRNGIMLKDGAALEKLAQIDTILFDKTGTLTMGQPALLEAGAIDEKNMGLAYALARGSKHPLSRAIAQAAETHGVIPAKVEQITEHPGQGIEAVYDGQTIRLGKRTWCGLQTNGKTASLNSGELELCLAIGDAEPIAFTFEDAMRPDADVVAAQLQKDGFMVEIVSGDREPTVRAFASRIGIEHFHAPLMPQEKVAYLQKLSQGGHKVLMVGDGLNDAPALSAGHTSMAPSTASDIGRMAADFVFLGERLSPIPLAIGIAKKARSLVHQNFGLALLYNLIAVPIAVTGHATPLIAAIAMSSSSLIVTLNALRLRLPSSSEPSAPLSPMNRGGGKDKKAMEPISA